MDTYICLDDNATEWRFTRSPTLFPGTFEDDVFAHVASRISLSASITSAFVTGNCRFKVKSAGGNLPGWCQYGMKMGYLKVHFWTCALKKWGQVFIRVRLLVNFYSVIMLAQSVVPAKGGGGGGGGATPPVKFDEKHVGREWGKLESFVLKKLYS